MNWPIFQIECRTPHSSNSIENATPLYSIPSWKWDPIQRRLDFRRLPGPVFDPPRRETAGRVTRWPCLWHNWKIDNLGVSDVTESETGLQFSYLFGSKIASSAPSHPNDFRNSFFGTFPYIVKNILRYISIHGDMYLIFFDLRIFWILVASSVGPNWLIPGSRPN